MIRPLSCEILALNVSEITEVGGRSTNQDALACAYHQELVCFVIADGAGGHNGGEIASRIVVQSVIEKFKQDASLHRDALSTYVDYAMASVKQRQAEDDQLKDMSATVATLVIDPCNRTAIWAHLGDTRIYLFRRNRIECVTKDHSLVQQFIDAGYCKADQLRTHPQRSKLFAAIGAETDTALCLPQKPIELEDGDSFLICTDGFWEWIDEDEMETALSMAASANAWLADMARTVGKRGCIPATQPDNYTAFAIWVGEPNEVTIRQ